MIRYYDKIFIALQPASVEINCQLLTLIYNKRTTWVLYLKTLKLTIYSVKYTILSVLSSFGDWWQLKVDMDMWDMALIVISYSNTLCLEKRDHNVFHNILYKTWVIVMKFTIYSFLNKSATKSKSPEFYRIYYKKNLGSFFWTRYMAWHPTQHTVGHFGAEWVIECHNICHVYIHRVQKKSDIFVFFIYFSQFFLTNFIKLSNSGVNVLKPVFLHEMDI